MILSLPTRGARAGSSIAGQDECVRQASKQAHEHEKHEKQRRPRTSNDDDSHPHDENAAAMNIVTPAEFEKQIVPADHPRTHCSIMAGTAVVMLCLVRETYGSAFVFVVG